MQLREPVDGAGAPIDLSIRVALCASRNTKQLAIVGFLRFVCPLRPGPVRVVGSGAICLWIAGRRCCGLVGLQQVGGEQATGRDGTTPIRASSHRTFAYLCLQEERGHEVYPDAYRLG